VFRVVIPARYASTRFPGKPLVLLGGKPMLQWVYENATRSGAREVVVATDDARIAAAARAFGAPVAMTSARHESGTDRIAEAAANAGWGPGEIVVNLQGDEPSLPPALLRQVAGLLEQDPGAAIATLATPVRSLAEYLDPNAVKVVAGEDGRALYFSRAPIPWHRDGAPGGGPDHAGARRHIGLYAYRVGALQRLAALPVAALEAAEKLEQLRALANGLAIRIADAIERPGQDINTPEDLARAAVELAGPGPGEDGGAAATPT
jgi:3-deoxy-manno-octulosonate cytidylyltransferase (CMP-KDO synthetase)